MKKLAIIIIVICFALLMGCAKNQYSLIETSDESINNSISSETESLNIPETDNEIVSGPVIKYDTQGKGHAPALNEFDPEKEYLEISRSIGIPTVDMLLYDSDYVVLCTVTEEKEGYYSNPDGTKTHENTGKIVENAWLTPYVIHIDEWLDGQGDDDMTVCLMNRVGLSLEEMEEYNIICGENFDSYLDVGKQYLVFISDWKNREAYGEITDEIFTPTWGIGGCFEKISENEYHRYCSFYLNEVKECIEKAKNAGSEIISDDDGESIFGPPINYDTQGKGHAPSLNEYDPEKEDLEMTRSLVVPDIDTMVSGSDCIVLGTITEEKEGYYSNPDGTKINEKTGKIVENAWLTPYVVHVDKWLDGQGDEYITVYLPNRVGISSELMEEYNIVCEEGYESYLDVGKQYLMFICDGKNREPSGEITDEEFTPLWGIRGCFERVNENLCYGYCYFDLSEVKECIKNTKK